MIENPNADGGQLHAIEIPFEAAPAMSFRPIADFIQLEIAKERSSGGIVLPGVVQGAPLITAKVIASGPECKMVKTGDTVLMVPAGIMGGAQGSMIDGRRLFFSQEKYLLAVVDARTN